MHDDFESVIYGDSISRECVMERMYPNWKLWAIASVYAGGCYVVGTIFFNRKIEDIVAKM